MARKARKPKKSEFSLRGVKAYVEKVSQKVAEQAAKDIITDLKILGPYWTGEFEAAWVAIPGATKQVPARLDSQFTIEERLSIEPKARKITEPKVAPLRGTGLNSYSIGNLMKYRDIALDLKPGRYSESKRNTADQDWYVGYINGGLLAQTLKQATGKVANNPKVKGFKGLAEANKRLGL